MRIGIFADCYRPSLNGLVSSVDSFKAELEKRGHEVFIFCPFVEGAAVEKNIIRLPAIDKFSPENYPIGIPLLPIINKTIKPLNLDIVHTQLPFLVGALGHRAANRLNLPEVHTYHSNLIEMSHFAPFWLSQRLTKRILKEITRSFCNGSDIVIAPSSPISSLLTSYGVTKPIVVNPSGVEINNFKKLTQSERKSLFLQYKIPSSKQIVLFAGRLSQEKNLLMLLECWPDILEKQPDAHLIFAGGGPFENTLQDQINKMRLSDTVTITGLLEKEEIAKFFGSSDVFAFPSVCETQGLVIIEAMAAGTPVVAMNKMGPKDIIKNSSSGYLANSKQDFTKKILSLLSDENLRDKISKTAKQTALDYSVERRTDKLLEVYEAAAKNHLNELPKERRFSAFIDKLLWKK